MKPVTASKPVHTLAEAEALLQQLPKSGAVVFKGEVGIRRSRYFFNLLGNPQDSFRSIHIAGTSGKGSTAYLIEALLRAGERTTGMTLSPHMHDFRERMLINGSYPSEDEVCRHLNELLPHLVAMQRSPHGLPSYFEVCLALAWLVFRHHRVDYAVVETGLGGRLDATNTITRPDKLAVLTTIGYDHTAVLGSTLEAIAGEKAGIIKPGIHVIAIEQDPVVKAVFRAAAKRHKATIEFTQPDQQLKNLTAHVGVTEFDLELGSWHWQRLRLPVSGRHQLDNAVLALRAVQYLSEQDDWNITEATARETLSKLRLPGRFEIRHYQNKLIILDGAHNPQKMAALAETLTALLPDAQATFLLTLKADKDARQTLSKIVPLAENIIITQPVTVQDWNLEADNTEHLAAALDELGFTRYQTISQPVQALQQALKRSPRILVITGSFYLLGEVYGHINKPVSS